MTLIPLTHRYETHTPVILYDLKLVIICTSDSIKNSLHSG